MDEKSFGKVGPNPEIDYSDGVAVEPLLGALVKAEGNLDSLSAIANDLYDRWPIRYHLSPERSYLLRHLNFEGLNVLEVGAGMGAISRFLAEKANTLTVLEGTQCRYSVLCSRLRDLKNWSGTVGNFSDYTVSAPFDVVCLIGVWEYSDLFTESKKGVSPYLAVLSQVRKCLRTEGILILAIENQLGLKYWAGHPEDHTGKTFDGICGYPLAKSPRTFSRQEVLANLHKAGFQSIDEYYPFPDYKLPASVLSSKFIESYPLLAAEIACHFSSESYLRQPLQLFPERVVTGEVARAGLLKEFANSFLLLACHSPASPVRAHLLKNELERRELAWHYASNRRYPTVTLFTGKNESLNIEKKLLKAVDSPSPLLFKGEHFEIEWRSPDIQTLVPGQPIRSVLCRYAYFEQWDVFLNLVSRFIAWSIERWKDNNNLGFVSGEAVDALVLNTQVMGDLDRLNDLEFKSFDLEWKLNSGMPLTWFIFRNVYSLREEGLLTDKAPFKTLHDLYHLLCQQFSVGESFEEDLQLEGLFQSLITPQKDARLISETLRTLFLKTSAPARYPRFTSLEEATQYHFTSLNSQIDALEKNIHHRDVERGNMQLHITQLTEQNRGLKAILDSPPHRAASWAKNILKQIPGIKRSVQFLSRHPLRET